MDNLLRIDRKCEMTEMGLRGVRGDGVGGRVVKGWDGGLFWKNVKLETREGRIEHSE